MIKVLSIFGTRPEAIKMAPLVKELERASHIENIVCVTAQHREMLDQVLDTFDIRPNYDLDIMKQRQSLTTITSNALLGLDGVIQEANPDMVLVHGDTSTTLVGSLAAFYHQILVGHVEAGLRTHDNYSPFPEEMNRKLTSHIVNMHFAPTMMNKQNLLNENIKENIYITGNTVIDALKHTVKDNYLFKNDILKNIDFDSHKYILLTVHRRENIGQPLVNICNAILKLADYHKDISFIYPVHLNPAVRETVHALLGEKERIHLIDPIDVQDMHNLIARSYMVMTDSGGLQEEAPSLGKPVLVLRAETERPEATEAGTVKVTGVDEEVIFAMANEIIVNDQEYQEMAKAINPYGDGRASERIVEAILYNFGLGEASPKDFVYLSNNF